MAVKISKSILAKGLLVFLLLSVGAIVGILVWTTEPETWSQLTRFKWTFIPVLFVLGALRWVFDGMSFVVMAKHGSQSSVSLWRATSIRLEGNLVASIVPVLVGTFSMHSYLLHKEKLSISESFALTVLRSILPVFLFLLNIPVLLFIRTEFESGKVFNELLRVFSLPVVVIIAFFIITLFYPQQIKNSASAFIHLWRKIKFMHVDRMLDLEERIFKEIDQFSQIFWMYLREKKLMLFRAMGWIFGAFVVDYFIAMAILWGFGYHPPLIQALAIQFLIRPIIYFAFTPGGAGIWEFTYLGFFSLFMPNFLIGISVLIWRLFLTYIPSAVGMVLLFKEFHTDRQLHHWIVEEGMLPDEEMPSLDDTVNRSEG